MDICLGVSKTERYCYPLRENTSAVKSIGISIGDTSPIFTYYFGIGWIANTAQSHTSSLHLLSAYMFLHLLVFVFLFFFVLQAGHCFLSSRPKVAKQLHLCRLSEEMFLH